MADYLLKGIDDEKWKRFRAICDMQGITMKQSFIHHINFMVAEGIARIIKEEAEDHKRKKGGKKK